MASDEEHETEVRRQMEQWDWLQGAEEHDGTKDAFRRFSDAIEESIGLKEADERTMPGDEAAQNGAMP